MWRNVDLPIWKKTKQESLTIFNFVIEEPELPCAQFYIFINTLMKSFD